MPSWLSDWVGTDMAPLAYYALVAAIILALIVVVLAVARKVMGVSAGPRVKGRGPRLAVMDVAVIDPKRKLILVRRDEIEHLLLIGGQNDLVVEASILRVPANARQIRTEPSLQAENDLGGIAAPGPRVAQRVPVAAQPPSPVAARATSPLARPVPSRAAPQPAPVPTPEPALSVEVESPAARPAAERSAPPVIASETGRAEPAQPPKVAAPSVEPPEAKRSVSAENSEMVLAPVVSSAPAAPAPAVAKPMTPAPIVTAPIATQPAFQAPSVESPAAPAVPVVETPSAAPKPAPTPIAAPPAVTSPVVAPPIPSPPVLSTPVSAASVVAPPVRATGIQAPPSPVQPPIPRTVSRDPVPSTPVPTPTSDAAVAPPRPQAPPFVRASLGAHPVGPAEPAPRNPLPAPTQPPIQPRSMATPTYPVKPAPAPNEPEVLPEAPDDRDEPSMTDTPSRVSPEPTAEAVLARLLAKAKEPVRGAPSVDIDYAPPRDRPNIVSQESAAPVPSIDEADAGERRPLSVRSFASTIQTRQGNGETVPARRDPEIAAPRPAPPSVPVPAPGASLVMPVTGAAQPVPATDPISVPPVPSRDALPVEERKPATSWNDEEEEDLEDFLSAQLNEGLGEDIWSAKETPASAPPVSIEPPSSPSAAAPIVAAPIVSPPEPAPVKAEPPVKRQLTLEEEMERLLGDFDLETSDRRR